MKILISTVQIPFVTGGAEFHAKNLKNAFIEHGHEAEIVTMPFMDQPPELIEDHIVAARLLELTYGWGGKSDLCIGLKFPAYFIPHENKVLWVLHQHRSAYELFDSEYSNLKNDEQGRIYRDIVRRADDRYMPEAKRIYANSKNVAGRMRRYNQIEATPLYHPCPDSEKFYVDQYENYILMPSRINATKRQMLAVEAMKLVKSDIKLYIMGGADNDIVKTGLLNQIEKFQIADRVKYLEYVPMEEKLKMYANARAVLFIPIDEDYGYITQEAMRAKKAVITTTDSGGPLEFLENGKSGLIVEPNPQEIAYAIDEFAASEKMARKLGKHAGEHILDMNISWENVVKELIK